MKIIADANKLRSELSRLIARYDAYYIAVAWASRHDIFNELLARKRFICEMVIGTDFHQTHPEALAPFEGFKPVRMMPIRGGTFHPKVYLFCDSKDDEQWECLIGSPNFTHAALHGNTELAVLLSPRDHAGTNERGRLMDLVHGYWKAAKPIDARLLAEYRLKYKARKPHVDLAETDVDIYEPRKGGRYPNLLSMSWQKFRKLVGEDAFFKKRHQLLLAVKQSFANHESYAEIPQEERKAIAGTLSDDSNTKKLMPGAFGSMIGAGDFKNLVNDSPKGLSAALDCIPAVGEVTKGDYDRFVRKFRTAFARKSRKGGPTTASRLLAMKRPDTFVCVNSKNRKLCLDLGTAPTTLTFERYWTDVVCQVRLADWWNAPLPETRIAADIWHARAAYLDALYYRG